MTGLAWRERQWCKYWNLQGTRGETQGSVVTSAARSDDIRLWKEGQRMVFRHQGEHHLWAQGCEWCRRQVQQRKARVLWWEDHGLAAGQLRTKVVLDWHLGQWDWGFLMEITCISSVTHSRCWSYTLKWARAQWIFVKSWVNEWLSGTETSLRLFLGTSSFTEYGSSKPGPEILGGLHCVNMNGRRWAWIGGPRGRLEAGVECQSQAPVGDRAEGVRGRLWRWGGRQREGVALDQGHWSSKSTPGHKPRPKVIQNDTCTPVFSEVLFTTAKTQKQPTFTDRWMDREDVVRVYNGAAVI